MDVRDGARPAGPLLEQGASRDVTIFANPDPSSYRHNVRRVFYIVFFYVSASAIALGPLFDAYLLNLGAESHSGNSLVGAVESVRGLLQLVLAYPIGALSDRMPRTKLLRRNLPVWSVGLAIVLLGVQLDSPVLVFAGVAVWAPCAQCFTSSAQVLVADFVTPGERTKYMANLTTTRLLANALGPLLQVVLLLCLRQNHWESSLLRRVICAGVVLWPGVVLFTCRLEDLAPLDRAQAAGPRAAAPASGNFRDEDLERRFCGVKVRLLVAVTLEATTIITSIGAGMTVKFFPLFFRVDYHFTPVEVCLLSLVYPVAIAGMVQYCRRLSTRLGRLQASLLFHFLGTGCLWLMVFCQWLPALLPLYVLRGALMNAKGPINRAIILDLVTSDVRGRWNSIMSVQTFTWSGSAALGGYIADAYGDYRATFVVTAVIYMISGFMVLALLVVYPKEQGTSRQAQGVQQVETGDGDAADAKRSPEGATPWTGGARPAAGQGGA